MPSSIEMIELVADALGPLVEEVAFVGGATVALYTNREYAAPIRPTDDVDCVVEVIGRIQYGKLEERLRELGFEHCMTSKVICRWIVNGVTVDVMPTDPSILGFSNRWYSPALKAREPCQLPNGKVISVFPLAYFLGCKFEALCNRGGKDWRIAHDLEDILFVLSGSDDPVADVRTAESEIRHYVAERCKELLNRSDLEELLDSHLGAEATLRAGIHRQIKQRLRLLAEV